MKLNEETTFSELPTGLRVKGKLDGILSVSVQRKTYLRDAEKGTTSWVWLFVSSITVYFPVSKAEAMRIVYHHLSMHDQALIPTTAPVWELFDQYPEGTTLPPQGHTLN